MDELPPASPPDDARPPHARGRWPWMVGALVLAALAMVFVVHHRGRAPGGGGRGGVDAGPVAVAVTPATAQQGDIDVNIAALGTVTPVYTSAVASQVTGQVVAVHYREGQKVDAGAPLVDIDARALQAQLAQARGTLARDQHVLAQARMDLDRYRAAWARNAIPKQTLDDQEKVVRQAESTVQADEAAVHYAEVQVGYCHITAPVSGRVGLRLVDPGNLVQANSTTPLVVVTQLDPITVIFSIPEDGIAAVQDEVRAGKPLRVDAFDRTNQRLIASGTLLTLDNQIDTTTGTVKARAEFANGDDRLFPNQFVNARLRVKTLAGVTLVPSSTIQHNGDAAFVYVLANGQAEQRTVKPGVSDLGQTAVEGVKPGELVANSSFEKLQPGAHVRLVGPPDGGSDGGPAP